MTTVPSVILGGQAVEKLYRSPSTPLKINTDDETMNGVFTHLGGSEEFL
jgi:hypothetical protein